MLDGFNTTVNGFERGLEKTGNNIKYGAATVATVGAGIGAAKLISKSPSIFANINKETAKTVYESGKEGAKAIGKKLISPAFYTSIFGAIKRNIEKVAVSLKETGFKNTAAKVVSKIFKPVKNVFTPILKRIPKFSDIPGMFKNLISKIPAGFSRVFGLLKRIPVIGWVAAATAAILFMIAHKHGYKSGQIDQKYDDREKLFMLAK